MKEDKPTDKKITNDNLSNISPIKEGLSNSNTKSIFKFKRDEDDDSDIYSDKFEDKEDLLSISSEDLETKMNRIINLKKRKEKRKKTRNESKKEKKKEKKLEMNQKKKWKM